MLIYGDLIAAGLEELASDPTTSLFSGRMYRNTTTGEMKVYTGSAWKTIVDLDTAQSLSSKDLLNSTASDVDIRFPTVGSSSKELQVPRLSTPDRLALSSPTTGRVVFDTTLGSLFVYNGSAWTPAGGGATLKSTITATHGFVEADIGSPLYLNGTVFTKAKADAANTAEVVGLLDSIIDANTFTLAMAGEVTINVSVSDVALVPGETYFLSPTSAGKITASEPTVVGHVSKPIGVAKTSNVLQFINMRGSVVGGANARTQISLSNAATSPVQNVSAYEAGELTGWVTIQATTPLKFYVSAQFAKNGAGTDYNISYQASGDTPPSGFGFSVTSSGIVQVTIPNVPGFGSASINYALNAPAVGVTLPLSISAKSVIGDASGASVATGYVGEKRLGTNVGSVAPINGVGSGVKTASITLTPGIWMLYAHVVLTPGTISGFSSIVAAVSAVDDGGYVSAGDFDFGFATSTGFTALSNRLNISPIYLNIVSNTSFFLNAGVYCSAVGSAVFSTNCNMYAVRIA